MTMSFPSVLVPAVMMVVAVSIIVPVVITDTFLAATPVPVPCIPVSVIIEMVIRPGLIDHYFITAVQIIPAIPSGQVGGKYPSPGIEVNELSAWYVVIGFYIGQVIIIGPVIPYRPPPWLCSNIDTYTYLCRRLHAGNGANRYQQ